MFHKVAESDHIGFLHAQIHKLLGHTQPEEPLFHGLGHLVGLFGYAREARNNGLKNVGQYAGTRRVALLDDGWQQRGQAQPVRQVVAYGAQGVFEGVREVQQAIVKGDASLKGSKAQSVTGFEIRGVFQGNGQPLVHKAD